MFTEKACPGLIQGGGFRFSEKIKTILSMPHSISRG